MIFRYEIHTLSPPRFDNGGVFEPLLDENDALSLMLNQCIHHRWIRLCKVRATYANANMEELELPKRVQHNATALS